MRKLSFLGRLVFGAASITVLTYGVFNFVSSNIKDQVQNYVEKQGKKVATQLITSSVEEIINENEINNLETVDSKYNISFDTVKINNLLAKLGKKLKIKSDLLNDSKFEIDKIETKKLSKNNIYEIPLGLAFNDAFFARVGPTVPIYFSFVNDFTIDCKSEVKEFGLNNGIISINLYVKTTTQVVIPLSSKDVEVEMMIPLSMKIIEGKVPSVVLGNKSIEDVSKILIEGKKV